MRTFMKFYFWPYLIGNLLGAVTSFRNGFSELEIIWSTFINVFSIICVFLYTFEKKWLPFLFWQVCFILFMADILYNLLFPSTLFGLPSRTIYTICYLFGVGIGMPALIAIYRYAFKNNT